MMEMKLSGVGGVLSRLRNIGDKVADNARKTMHRTADRVVREAKLNAPIEEGDLEASITKHVKYEDRGRLAIDVTAGGENAIRNIDQYAALMHENYEQIIRNPPQDDYGRELRERTRAKQAANPGRYVGGKFLERALEAEREKLMAKLIQSTTDIVRES